MSLLTLSEQRYVIRAALESYKSDLVSKHGCVAVAQGKIIGHGHNSSRTQSHDGFINNTCSCHAEIAAIRDVFRTNFDKTYCKYKERLKTCFLRG